MKQTPLYEEHLKLKAKMVEFAGYQMPIQYHSIQQEHLATRSHAGIFDVSHMGEIWVEGEKSLVYLQQIFTNDFTSLKPGAIRYTLLLNTSGETLDDCLVYCFSSTRYMVVVNASNQTKDYAWMMSQCIEGVTLDNKSDDTAQVALQGPKSKEIIQQLTHQLPEKYFHFKENVSFLGHEYLISQTGYTGEFGYEIYGSNEAIVLLWQKLLSLGCEPVGLGARDTLRLEAGMPLYGHELSASIYPLDAGVDFAIKTSKSSFNGSSTLNQQSMLMRIGLISDGRFIAREKDDVYQDGQRVGVVTSGTFSPSLQKPIAMAMVERKVDCEKDFEIRGRRSGEFKYHDLPFIKK